MTVAAQRELGSIDRALRTPSGSGIPAGPETQIPNSLDLLRMQQQEQLDRLRRFSLLPERPSGSQILAAASSDTGGSLNERRGRQF